MSANAKHTPGPWAYGHLGKEALWVGPSHDEPPVAIVPWDTDGARDNARDNAQLLSVLPDFLDALIHCEDLLSFHEGSAKPERDGAHPTVRINGEDFNVALAVVRAALAKAGGAA
jgi:hypothetical protein